MVLLAIVLAVVLVFADPIGKAYGYPLLALMTIAGYAFFAGRRLAPLIIAVAVVLALVPLAGVASSLGRDNDAEMTGSCHAPVAAFFVEDETGWTEFRAQTGGETQAAPQAVQRQQLCGRLAGRRLATAFGLAVVAALFAAATSRRSASDFRVRSYH